MVIHILNKYNIDKSRFEDLKRGKNPLDGIPKNQRGLMNRAQILDRIRNKLTLPRVLLQKLEQLSTQYPLAIQSIDELIEEIKRDDDHETTHE